ncbi:hypothetical protein [Pseudomonas sp. MWU13-2517]|uniref:hypothetical protein n=1 Tax=Pseudomonas sp. MWU13-2517 TaxID=2929055 RepID=UPI00200C842D|nr:hypothetical protein [Pseudomonas sp. MWU13-2517]
MAIVATTDSVQRSKATSAYLIKNPREIKNSFTPTDASKAADILKIGAEKEITELKSFLKDYNMTSISTNELKKVGRQLYSSGAIDVMAFGMFISGNGEFDAKGNQANTHVKFNVIALFNQKLEEYAKFLEDFPGHATPDNLTWKKAMIAANHAIGALTYFVNSTNNKLSVDEQA